jgi:cyclohexanecarboxylate-CoA ligase
VVRGPELFLGYLDPALNAAAFTDDGHFRTGDLASVDALGAVTIRGRQKDIILRGGENISAKEVEELLIEHPAVREVAVVAMPDPVLVEKACAFVVPEPGEGFDLGAMTAHLEKYRLARQKFPERLELVAELPMTASGKVQKFVLRDAIRASLAQEQGAAAADRP